MSKRKLTKEEEMVMIAYVRERCSEIIDFLESITEEEEEIIKETEEFEVLSFKQGSE